MTIKTETTAKDTLTKITGGIFKKLEAEERHIRQVLADNSEDLEDLRSDWQERDDPAERNIRYVEWGQYSSLQDALAGVLDAKQKVIDGKYGLCEDCGNKISPKRLAAVISARRCLECQKIADNG